MKRTKAFNFALAAFACAAMLTACGDSGKKSSGNGGLTGGLEDNSEEYLAEDVNAIDQALPEIMVLPSDQVLKANGALRNTSAGVERDYQKFLLANSNNKALVSAIQDEFNKLDYPLNDLEQTLKQLATREAEDEADELAKDPKTMLLAVAAPDIIIELDYGSKIDRKTYNSTLNYTISMIDPYTNKVFSTKSAEGADGNSMADAFATSFRQQMPEITKDIRKYFSGILTKGREISVRVTVDAGANVNLSDESIEGDTYSDWLDEYMDSHTVKGAYKLKTNTKNELSFTNVRIATLNEDGTQNSSYDWGKALAKTMRKQLGVKVSNRTQGLGDVHLVIMGM